MLPYDLIFTIGTFVGLLLLGLIVGGTIERRHFKALAQRESESSDILITQLKSYPAAVPGEQPPRMFVAEVVIGSDYLKSFFGKLRNIFGGNVPGYQNLMERARREALLRVVDQARLEGYNALCNVRLQTADVGGSSATRQVAMASILVSATAYHADHS